MSTGWQPPIPSGALYSKPARALGSALPLLIYVYDLVQRDGTAAISLRDAALDLEESYPKIKRWWAEVRSGPWFSQVVSRGNLGYVVTFKSGWIAWRVLEARKTCDGPAEPPAPPTSFEIEEDETPLGATSTAKDIRGTPEGTYLYPQDLEGRLKDIRGTPEGTNMIPRENVYGIHVSQSNNPSPSPLPARTPEATERVRRVVMVMAQCGVTSAKKAQEIALANPDLDPDTIKHSFENLYSTGWRTPWILQLLEASPPTPGQPYAPIPPPKLGQRPSDLPPAQPPKTMGLPADVEDKIRRALAQPNRPG